MCRRTRPGTAAAFVLVLFATLPRTVQAQGAITTERVADGLHVVRGAVDMIGASVGDDGLLLVDAGYMETLDDVRAALRGLTDAAPRILINTHWHHAFANAGFGSSAVIVAHAATGERLRRTNWMYNRVVEPAPPEALPVVTFQDSLTLHFNGETIRLRHLPRAHTDGDVVVFFENANVVFTGDVFVEHVPFIDVHSGGDVAGLSAAVDSLLRWIPDSAVIVPGHGEPTTREGLVAFRAMLDASLEFAQARVRQGSSLAEIRREGLPAPWDAWVDVIPDSIFLEGVYAGLRPPPCAFVNGRWFDGTTFRQDTMYVVEGLFSAARQAGADCRIDLGGGWVVPPFGDAHVHALNAHATLRAESDAYLDEGVFHAMVQDPILSIDAALLERLEHPLTVDAAFTRGVITPSWGLIADFYRNMVEGGVFGPDVRFEDLLDHNLFLVDDAADLSDKWPEIAAHNDAFVKVILAFSDELEARRADPATFGASPPSYSRKPGLDAALLPALVRRAHADGLRVSVHVETAADFRIAVRAGADIIAHLPGAWQIGPRTGVRTNTLDPWMLTEADARAARDAGVTVVTTAIRPDSAPGVEPHRTVHRHNLRLLAEAGVPIAIGTDGVAPAHREARHLAGLGALSNLDVLRSLTHTTPALIFPGRRIGRLEDGYEASFVVLDADPLADPAALARIRNRVKQGHVLGPPTVAR